MVKVISALLVVLGVAGLALGDPVINISHNLFAAYGDTDAWNRVKVSGGEPVQGLEFNIVIGGDVSGPIFVAMPDILNYTIFDGNNDGYFPGSSWWDRSAYAGTVTSSGAVSADGVLATVRFDATGITNHTSYTVSLTGMVEGPTNFAGIPATITNGNLIVTDPGDSDGNYKVDIVDLTALSANWSALPINAGIDKLWHQGNFNPGDSSVNPAKDWVVDIVDLTALSANWSFVGSPPPVPEPLTLSLLAAGAVVLLRRRR